MTGSLEVASATLSGTVSAASGGHFVSTGLVQLSAGAVLAVDATSFMELGTAGAATAGDLTVDASGNVLLLGDGTAAAAVVNNGQINASNANAGGNTLEITGAVTGTGAFSIGVGTNPSPGNYTPGGIPRFDGSVAATQVVAFDSAANSQEAPTLILADPMAFHGTVSDFTSPGDAIELTAIDNVTSTDLVNGDTLEISLSSGGPIDLAMSGNFAGEFFHHALVGSDTLITEDNVPCYLAGTLIMTDRGEVAVETLTAGDRAITLSGAARPIKWIGFGRTLVTPRNRCDVSAVIIRRGGPGGQRAAPRSLAHPPSRDPGRRGAGPVEHSGQRRLGAVGRCRTRRGVLPR